LLGYNPFGVSEVRVSLSRPAMATFAIGDIHGNIRALDDLLVLITGEIGAGDTVVFLGDYIDRGANSKECIERILDFQKAGKAKVVTLLGNHEQWLMRTYHDHTRHSWILGMEALSTIQSYSPSAAAALVEGLGNLGPRIVAERVSLPYQLFFDSVPPEHLLAHAGGGMRTWRSKSERRQRRGTGAGTPGLGDGQISRPV
jgi:hypothetical protein